jgi:hypothetical protein
MSASTSSTSEDFRTDIEIAELGTEKIMLKKLCMRMGKNVIAQNDRTA